MRTTDNPLPLSARSKIVAILNQRLVESIDLYQQLKHAHWNVRGPGFLSIHELFDQIAESVEVNVDQIAERITALGGVALGTTQVVSKESRLPSYDVDLVNVNDHLKALIKSLAAYLKALRVDTAQIDELDSVTTELLNSITEEQEKHLWFLEAHIG
jgi:starvation-inducible DNA-binding protein